MKNINTLKAIAYVFYTLSFIITAVGLAKLGTDTHAAAQLLSTPALMVMFGNFLVRRSRNA